jgi:hypothetical protein
VRTLPFRMAAHPPMRTNSTPASQKACTATSNFTGAPDRSVPQHGYRVPAFAIRARREKGGVAWEEGQIDSEVSRGGYAAGRSGVEKSLLGSCELFRSQGLQTFHGLIVSGDIGIFSINRGRSGRFPRRVRIHGFASLFDQVGQGGHLHRPATRAGRRSAIRSDSAAGECIRGHAHPGCLLYRHDEVSDQPRRFRIGHSSSQP